MKPFDERVRATVAIGKAVVSKCAGDLDEIEKSGLPRAALVTMLAFAAQGEWLGMSTNTKEAFRNRSYTAKLAAERIDCPEGRSQKLRKNISDAGRLLRSRGRKDHDEGVAMLVKGIRRYTNDFNSWEALSRVLEQAYIAAGADESRTDHLTGDMLRKIGKRRNTP